MMIVTTTPYVEGKKVKEYLKVVSGETVMGANMMRDFFASITDALGGRSKSYESKLAEGKDLAITEMEEKAATIGANAVIGVDIDFSEMREGMIMIIATGTAVITE